MALQELVNYYFVHYTIQSIIHTKVHETDKLLAFTAGGCRAIFLLAIYIEKEIIWSSSACTL